MRHTEPIKLPERFIIRFDGLVRGFEIEVGIFSIV